MQAINQLIQILSHKAQWTARQHKETTKSTSASRPDANCDLLPLWEGGALCQGLCPVPPIETG